MKMGKGIAVLNKVVVKSYILNSICEFGSFFYF